MKFSVPSLNDIYPPINVHSTHMYVFLLIFCLIGYSSHQRIFQMFNCLHV